MSLQKRKSLLPRPIVTGVAVALLLSGVVAPGFAAEVEQERFPTRLSVREAGVLEILRGFVESIGGPGDLVIGVPKKVPVEGESFDEAWGYNAFDGGYFYYRAGSYLPIGEYRGPGNPPKLDPNSFNVKRKLALLTGKLDKKYRAFFYPQGLSTSLWAKRKGDAVVVTQSDQNVFASAVAFSAKTGHLLGGRRDVGLVDPSDIYVHREDELNWETADWQAAKLWLRSKDPTKGKDDYSHAYVDRKGFYVGQETYPSRTEIDNWKVAEVAPRDVSFDEWSDKKIRAFRDKALEDEKKAALEEKRRRDATAARRGKINEKLAEKLGGLILASPPGMEGKIWAPGGVHEGQEMTVHSYLLGNDKLVDGAPYVEFFDPDRTGAELVVGGKPPKPSWPFIRSIDVASHIVDALDLVGQGALSLFFEGKGKSYFDGFMSFAGKTHGEKIVVDAYSKSNTGDLKTKGTSEQKRTFAFSAKNKAYLGGEETLTSDYPRSSIRVAVSSALSAEEKRTWTSTRMTRIDEDPPYQGIGGDLRLTRRNGEILINRRGLYFTPDTRKKNPRFVHLLSYEQLKAYAPKLISDFFRGVHPPKKRGSR